MTTTLSATTPRVPASTTTTAAFPGSSRRDVAAVRSLQAVGAGQSALGVALLFAGIAGSSTGPAPVAIAVLGAAFLLLGVATASRPRPIVTRASIGTLAVLADSALTVAGVSLLLLAWAELSTAGAATILVGVVIAVVAAIATAFVGTDDRAAK
ncbi:hypothetical protein [Nocardia sp. NPDC050717]|uniref:hypothetical protein n=1 Tax=Nocardia sp. NPDC050717 TaxID=3157221 RepID=UPI0033E8FB36